MRRLLVPLGCAAALAAGCGNERQSLPRLSEADAPRGAKQVAFERAGVSFRAPANWFVQDREPPGVFVAQSGATFVTGFAYRREEDLPQGAGELRAAQRRLTGEIEERDPGFDLRRARTLEVAGAPALELRGTQTISKRRLETRSVHVYRGEVEYVFEALAPAHTFGRASDVLTRVLRTVKLRGTIRRERRRREPGRR